MTATDYLNSSKGPTLVAVYGSLITILTFNGLIITMCIRSKWADLPTGAAGVMLLIIGLVSATHLAALKINQSAAAPQQPSVPTPPPPTEGAA